MLWSILHYPGWQIHALMPKPIPSSACGAALAQGQCPPEAGIACLHPCLPGGAWGGQEGGNWQHSSALICMLQHFHRVLVCLCAPACICQLLREWDLKPSSQQLFVHMAQEAKALVNPQRFWGLLPRRLPGSGLAQ